MLISIICIDKPDSGDVRANARPTHIEYLKSAGETIVFAGAMTDDDGGTVVGSLIMVNLPSLDDARAFAAGDPYAEAGLFQSTDIRPTRKSIFNPASAD